MSAQATDMVAGMLGVLTVEQMSVRFQDRVARSSASFEYSPQFRAAVVRGPARHLADPRRFPQDRPRRERLPSASLLACCSRTRPHARYGHAVLRSSVRPLRSVGDTRRTRPFGSTDSRSPAGRPPGTPIPARSRVSRSAADWLSSPERMCSGCALRRHDRSAQRSARSVARSARSCSGAIYGQVPPVHGRRSVTLIHQPRQTEVNDHGYSPRPPLAARCSTA